MTYRHLLIMLIGIVVLMALPLPPPAPTPLEATQEVQHTTSNKQQATPAEISPTQPPAPMVELPKRPETSRADEEHREQQRHQATSDWITRFTGALVVVGLVQLVVIAVQAWLMRRTLHVTQQSADAATHSAHIAKQALQVSQRAYVTVDHWRMNDFAIGENPDITFDVINTGTTPAKIIDVRLDFLIAPQLPPTPQYGGHPRTIPGHLRPNSSAPIKSWLAEPLTSEAHRHIVNDQSFLWIWSRITYEDVFHIQHHTAFAVQWRHGYGFTFPSIPGYAYAD
jgi:hypothetical protein